jgi:hypothetical protein
MSYYRDVCPYTDEVYEIIVTCDNLFQSGVIIHFFMERSFLSSKVGGGGIREENTRSVSAIFFTTLDICTEICIGRFRPSYQKVELTHSPN